MSLIAFDYSCGIATESLNIEDEISKSQTFRTSSIDSPISSPKELKLIFCSFYAGILQFGLLTLIQLHIY